MLQAPTFVTIGHVTRDLHADGSFTLGGTVTFAALTAYRLGLAAGIITSADAQLQAALPHYLPGIALQVRSSAHSTSFANYYDDTGFRTQYLHNRADSLTAMDVPDSWKSAPVILLGPLAQELSPDFVELFPAHPARSWLPHLRAGYGVGMMMDASGLLPGPVRSASYQPWMF